MMSVRCGRLLVPGLSRVLCCRREFSVSYCSQVETRTERFTGPGLKEFIKGSTSTPPDLEPYIPPYVDPAAIHGRNRKVYFDVYGCQMNVNDTEIVRSILESAGFSKTDDVSTADVILMMTCAIRDNAEKKIWNKLVHYKHLKKKRSPGAVKIGVLGCMAERLKEKLVEREGCIDLVCGPDAYKDLPRLLALSDSHQTAVNVLLSLDETYADVVPVRLNSDSVTAYVSIMRGCDNMCSYCIVPFTRGRERSRPVDSILREVTTLAQQGVKEITLLGQNVNSYRDTSSGRRSVGEETVLAPGFSTVYKSKAGGLRFAQLLDKVATAVPHVRIRFTSPHPKDFPLQVLETMSSHSNVCKSIHLPAQSGSDSVLQRMRRGYTAQAYLSLVDTVRSILGQHVTLSSDFICGFCSESEEDFQATLDLISTVQYNVAYLFAYSMREKTTAHRRYKDDVPEEIKQQRLLSMISEFRRCADLANRMFLDTDQTVLVEGVSKRSEESLQGRTDGNIKVIIPAVPVPEFPGSSTCRHMQPGDFVTIRITESNSQVLKGQPLYMTSL